MYLEAHDGEIANVTAGTLAVSHCGFQGPYDIESSVKDWLRTYRTPRRFYAFEFNYVQAVYARDENGNVHCVGRSPVWRAEWSLPFLHAGKMNVASIVLGLKIQNLNQAIEWARTSLADGASTAVLLDRQGVIAAWEQEDSKMILVASTPRPHPREKCR